MTWRVAKSLDKLLEQINEIAPNRSKVSDGSIGDASHQASATSDHNPHCGPGVVTARDFTDDPQQGADMDAIANALRESKDERLKYVIWAGRMFSSYPASGYAAFQWRPYSGVNPHIKHMHVSVQCNASKDSVKDWQIGEWTDMATEAELRKIVKEEVREAVKQLAVGKSQEGWNSDKVNLKAVLEKK